MEVVKTTIKGSPFIGVFCAATDKLALVPKTIESKELKKIENALSIECVKVNIASSSIIGVLAKGNSKGFLVPEIIEKDEIEEMKEIGIKTMIVKGNLAIGNLAALNDKTMVVGGKIGKKEQKNIKNFLKVKMLEVKLGDSELVGSSIVASNKGFIINPEVSKKDFKKIEKAFGFKGKATTANYGDLFVGNSVIANSNGIAVGAYTSQAEILRIEEGLSGEE